MARIHKQLPPPHEKYPWEDWFDGRVWELIQDEDFDAAITSMVPMIHIAAKRYDCTVQTRIVGTSVFMQAYHPKKGTNHS